jgi:hypothetical protein
MISEPNAGNLLSSNYSWKIVSASVKGLSHERNNLPCQDASLWRVVYGILIVAVADGAGSAKFSDLGAKVAVESALDYLESIISHNYCSSETDDVNPRNKVFNHILTSWDSVSVDVARQAYEAVQHEAIESNLPIRDLASTLMVVIASENGIATFQIGDGSVVVNTFDNRYIALTVPPQTEYINETLFLVSSSAIEQMQIKTFEKVKQLAIMTDGIQMLALEMKERKPFNPFFHTIFNFAANDQPEDTSVIELEKFLISKRVREHSHDDITLFVASLTELPGSVIHNELSSGCINAKESVDNNEVRSSLNINASHRSFMYCSGYFRSFLYLISRFCLSLCN